MDCESVDCESVDCESVDCDSVDCESVDFESADCEGVDCENMCCESEDSIILTQNRSQWLALGHTVELWITESRVKFFNSFCTMELNVRT